MAPRQSYGTLPSVESTDSDDCVPLVSGNTDDCIVGNKKKNGVSKNCCVRGCKGIGVALVAVVVVGVTIYSTVTRNVMSSLRIGILPARPTTATLDSISTGLAISPVDDLGLLSVEREASLKPSQAWGRRFQQSSSSHQPTNTGMQPLPTNIWYLNLLSDLAGTPSNTEASRVYTVPYIIDTVGPIPGIRVHWPTIQASTRNIQMVVDVENGLTLGGVGVNPQYTLADNGQNVSLLGLSLEWEPSSLSNNNMTTRRTKTNKTKTRSSEGSMVAHIVRGMPMATMVYTGKDIVPSIVGGKVPASDPLIDGTTALKCGVLGRDDDGQLLPSRVEDSQPVQREVLLHFKGSDFTWVVFFSKPVSVSCSSAPDPESFQGTTPGGATMMGSMFQFQVTSVGANGDDHDEEPLIVRTALVDECTTGHAAIMAHCEESRRMKDPEGYLDILRKTAHVYPQGSPKVDLHFSDAVQNVSRISFDWDVSSSMDSHGSDDDDELLMYALPFQQEMLEGIGGVSTNKVLTDFCKPTFHGSTCLVQGRKWSLVETVEPKPSFYGARPPEASAIPTLVESLTTDLKNRLSDNLQRGAADTYFSGKILARQGRVLLIASELLELANDDNGSACKTLYNEANIDPERCDRSVRAAKKATLPTKNDIEAALDDLREGVEIWASGLGEAPYVYDSTWGGLVNCGCNYTLPKGAKGDHGFCNNVFPNCPALVDVNEDFGNGYYNDHHYHYGYHIGAAAVVAKLDPEWGLKWFDRIMLYVRDIANPSDDDEFFPQFRHKDWYLGSSWASGLASFNEMHGRNQESSSEAIAAYENIALFGTAVVDAIASFSSQFSIPAALQSSAKQVQQVGSLLTATELHATQRYWHVWNTTSHVNTYPAEYTKPVVGMMYETMASFQTWFNGGDMASIGIQLLPFTPVSEARDDPDWVAGVYPIYNSSCESEKEFCVKNGWSVMLTGLEAIIGQREKAITDALAIPQSVFSSDGGCGHSRSNVIWYIATRPDVDTKSRL
jgi:hypothetical protein